MKTQPVLILCACGWSGVVALRGACPECARKYTDRIDRGRLDALRLVAAQPDAYIEPQRRKRMITIGVIKSIGKRPPPTGEAVPAVTKRIHHVTDQGKLVLAVADRTTTSRGGVAQMAASKRL